jgi:hypothetical protein
MSFKTGSAWVSTAKPYGKSNATRAIFLTDSLTGKNQVWFSKGRALSGPTRAVEAARGLAIDGINFNNFKAIEPRPLIKNNKLYFLISIVPNNNSTVTKSVIVDAKTNKVIEIFDHDQDTGADQNLKNFLAGKNYLKNNKNQTVTKNIDEKSSLDKLSRQEIIDYLKQSIKSQQQLLEDIQSK